MGLADRVLTGIAQKMELPADVLAGVPRVVLIGKNEFQIEPHCGLLKYSQSEVEVNSKLGPITVEGSGITIKLMNQNSIIMTGRLSCVKLPEERHD